jgi:D-cysteine desulfhydrase
MGTAVGLALGIALAGEKIEINAVRVSDRLIMNSAAMRILLRKTIAMMRALDDSIPTDLEAATNIRIRDGFYGPGYAQGTAATDEAIKFAHDQLGLTLETTYTGKTMAALLTDMRNPEMGNLKFLYWHTYNSVDFGLSPDKPLDSNALPDQFLKYFAD